MMMETAREMNCKILFCSLYQYQSSKINKTYFLTDGASHLCPSKIVKKEEC